MANGRLSTSTDRGRPLSCPIEGPGGGSVLQISARRPSVRGMSLLVLPPWILLESPHSHHPTTTTTTTTTTITFIPASRKATHKAIASSEQMATSPCRLSISVSVPSQGGASSGPGALGAGPEAHPPPQAAIGLTCLGSRVPSCGFTQGLGSQEIPDLSSSRIRLGKADEPATPAPTCPMGESERGAHARSLWPQTASLTRLPNSPPVPSRPPGPRLTLLPQCGERDPLRVPPLSPSSFSDVYLHRSPPIPSSIGPGGFQPHHS